MDSDNKFIKSINYRLLFERIANFNFEHFDDNFVMEINQILNLETIRNKKMLNLISTLNSNEADLILFFNLVSSTIRNEISRKNHKLKNNDFEIVKSDNNIPKYLDEVFELNRKRCGLFFILNTFIKNEEDIIELIINQIDNYNRGTLSDIDHEQQLARISTPMDHNDFEQCIDIIVQNSKRHELFVKLSKLNFDELSPLFIQDIDYFLSYEKHREKALIESLSSIFNLFRSFKSNMMNLHQLISNEFRSKDEKLKNGLGLNEIQLKCEINLKLIDMNLSLFKNYNDKSDQENKIIQNNIRMLNYVDQ